MKLTITPELIGKLKDMRKLSRRMVVVKNKVKIMYNKKNG